MVTGEYEPVEIWPQDVDGNRIEQPDFAFWCRECFGTFNLPTDALGCPHCGSLLIAGVPCTCTSGQQCVPCQEYFWALGER